MVSSVSDFLSHLSFLFFLIGVVLFLLRGMGPPGTKSVDRKKFTEIQDEINRNLIALKDEPLNRRILLYTGKYFFSYLYYRMDLIFIFFMGGGLFLMMLSGWVR